jgi:hypothetical protein
MLDFPASPTVGQKYSPVGAPSYAWDGEKWTTMMSVLASALPSNANPRMDGVATAGVAATYSRGDHVHPTDTTLAPINNASFTGTLTAEMISLSGDITVTGKITATANQQLLGYVGGAGAGGAVTQADANILLYDFGGGNWCGIGADPSGHVWLRTGTSGSPAPSFYVNATNQAVVFQTVGFPTAGAGDNSTRLANTAFVKARTPSNVYPLAGGTVTGNVTIVGDMYVNNGGNYGVLYLGNTGSYYLQWDGSNYNLANGHAFASNGRLYGTNDWNPAGLYTNIRLAYIADQTIGLYTGMTESYSGSYMTGASGDQGSGGAWLRRFRQMQYYTTGWFAIGYA